MVGTALDYEQLRATTNLIASAPTTIALQRRQNRTRTAAGGFSGGDEWEAAGQPFSAFFGAKIQDDLPIQQNDGERVISYYTLVALPGTDIQEGDQFVIEGITYTVVSVHRHLDYEVKADVETYYGGHH